MDKMLGAYGNRSPDGHRSDRDDMVRDGILLDTPDGRGDIHMYHSSSGSDKHHDRHHYHPYRRSDRGYFLDEFKKAKQPTFGGDLKKTEDA